MPADAQLVEFYQQFAFEKPILKDVENDVPNIGKSLQHFIGVPQPGRNRFLDYGGGFGIYSKAARRLGWEPSLFDYDCGCLEFAKSEMGVTQTADNLAAFEGAKFDVIFGYHVIEHWNRIDDNMRSLLGLLAPGGKIVFATPHANSCEKWVRPYHLRNYARGLVAGGKSWGRAILLTAKLESFLCWDPPRHLFAFSADALREIGRAHGLTSRIETGYNTSLIHEPRQYVVPNPFAPRFKVPAGASKFASVSRKWVACFSWVGCKLLSRLLPDRGEQLYVTYTASR
jgi:SAM-dependent methyltransferase